MTTESNYGYSVFWNVPKGTFIDCDSVEKSGFPIDDVKRSPLDLFRRVINWFTKKYDVDVLGRRKGEYFFSNEKNEFSVALSDDNKQIDGTNCPDDVLNKMNEMFEKLSNNFSDDDIRSCLKTFVKKNGGKKLLKRGGVYFIPSTSEDAIIRIADILSVDPFDNVQFFFSRIYESSIDINELYQPEQKSSTNGSSLSTIRRVCDIHDVLSSVPNGGRIPIQERKIINTIDVINNDSNSDEKLVEAAENLHAIFLLNPIKAKNEILNNFYNILISKTDDLVDAIKNDL